MKSFLCLFLISINLLCFSSENECHDNWLAGLNLFENHEYEEAHKMFLSAASKMSEEELQEIPDVLMDLAQSHYLLGDYDQALTIANTLSTSDTLSDEQKLVCGNLIVSSLWKQGKTDAAIDAYKKYITNSPLTPKCHFKADRVIIRNVPSCDVYANTVKSLLMDELCNEPEDFHEHGSVWIFDIKKGCKCGCKELELNSWRANNNKRTPDAIRGCCNSCSSLSVAATVICGIIPNIVCKVGCTLFIEMLRQVCESCCYNGGIEDKCWERFSYWKDDFKKNNPNCPHPNDVQ